MTIKSRVEPRINPTRNLKSCSLSQCLCWDKEASGRSVAALLHFWCRACCNKCWHMTGAHSQELHTGKFHWAQHWIAVESRAGWHTLLTIPYHSIQYRTIPYLTTPYHTTPHHTTPLQAWAVGIWLASPSIASSRLKSPWSLLGHPPNVLSNHFLQQSWCSCPKIVLIIVSTAIFTIYIIILTNVVYQHSGEPDNRKMILIQKLKRQIF